jgi:hypothetical protein
MVNVYIYLSLIQCFIYVGGRPVDIGVNRSLYVPKQKPMAFALYCRLGVYYVCAYCVTICDYLHCMYLYSKVCEDGLIVVNSPQTCRQDKNNKIN